MRETKSSKAICSAQGCNEHVKYIGLCGKHYKRQWRHGDASRTLIRPKGTRSLECCAVPGCGKPLKCLDLCNTHHTRLTRYGRLEKIMADQGSWRAGPGGYIVGTINGKQVYQHVYVAEKVLGCKLPPGAVVHHVNGVRYDNRSTNLVICPDQSYHMLIHKLMREKNISFVSNVNR